MSPKEPGEFDEVTPGTATGASNEQAYAFQFGVAPPAAPFTAHTRLLAPFSGVTPEGDQSFGLFVGTGHQDDFVEVTHVLRCVFNYEGTRGAGRRVKVRRPAAVSTRQLEVRPAAFGAGRVDQPEG